MTDIARQTKAKARLVAVVVTCNRLEKLKTTLDRLSSSPADDLVGIIVVDNASSDGTQDWLLGQTEARLDLLLNQNNKGGAGGFSQGIEHALRDHNPDWIVVMDDDGRPEVGALRAFHDLDPKAENWAGIASAVYFPDGTICDMNRPSCNPFWHKAVFLRTAIGLGGREGFHINPNCYESTEATEIDITSFVGFFVSAEAARQVPLPDPNLFIYGDDGLYSLGLSKQGHRLVFHPAVRFEHDCSTFSAEETRRFTPLWKVYYYHRNLLFLYREAAGWMFWLLLFLVIPKWVLRVRDHSGDGRTYFRLLRRAIYDGLRNDRRIEHDEVLKLAKSADS